MKYIKKYETDKHMKPFESFNIFENLAKDYTIKLDIKDLEDYVNKFCKDFSWKDAPIYRGIHNSDNVLLINPKAIERESANTQNYYTWILDNSPFYNKYPKRSQSLICATNKDIAEDFGSSVWRVIPFDGSKISMCNSSDLWEAFGEVEKVLGDENTYSLNDFNIDLDILYEMVFAVSFRNTDAEGFFTNLEKFLNEIKRLRGTDELKKLINSHKNPEWINKKFIRNIPTTIDGIFDLFSPDNNQIKVYDYNDFKKMDGYDVEIWTDSKSIFVQESIADILEERERKGKEIYKDIEDLEIYGIQ